MTSLSLSGIMIDMYAINERGVVLDPDTLADLIRQLTNEQRNTLTEAGFILSYEVLYNYMC